MNDVVYVIDEHYGQYQDFMRNQTHGGVEYRRISTREGVCGIDRGSRVIMLSHNVPDELMNELRIRGCMISFYDLYQPAPKAEKINKINEINKTLILCN